MAGSITSPIGPAQQVRGTLLQVGTAGSPETMYTIANATDVSLPVMSDTVDVTNVGNLWKVKIPTLLDMGKISFKIYWVMEEDTHRNSLNGGGVPAGLRYLLVNQLVRDFQFVYPDGNLSTDAFPAYTTSFAITGKVGGVYEASIELTYAGPNPPSLV
jgi:hypothetical protein